MMGGGMMGGMPQQGYGAMGSMQQDNRYSPYGGGPSGLPAGWEAANDPSSGKQYYFNRATGETKWDHPSGSAGASPSSSFASSDPSLPAGWESAKDPSGKEYYFNRSTGETKWERPSAGTAPGGSSNFASSD